MKMCKNRQFFGKRTTFGLMFGMTASFFVAEIVVGYMTNSTALVADSFHMLSDVLSLVVGFLAVVYSRKSSKYNTYGWARAEVLSALANAVFLLALCFTIIVSAIQRIVEIERIENPLLVLYVGGAGLVINLLGLALFHGHSHGHHHHHDHNHNHDDPHDQDYDKILVDGNELALEKREEATAEAKKHRHSDHHGTQLNMKGVFLHVLGDALGSVVVLMSALTIYFAEGEWRFYVDPVMSLVIAAIIVITTLPLLKRSGLILLQNPPDHIDQNDLICELRKIHGILDIHEFHVWQLSGDVFIASAHVTMHKGDNFNEAAMEINKIFHQKGVHSSTLQPEFYDCSENGSKCGASTCHFLSNTQLEAITEKEVITIKIPGAETRQRSGSSPCLLPCISNKCDKFRCCSNIQERKLSKSSTSNGCRNQRLLSTNPCFVNIDVYTGDIPSPTESDNKQVELPVPDQCGTDA